MKTDSGLSVYCNGNADFPNVWERRWPTCTIPIYKGAAAPLQLEVDMSEHQAIMGQLVSPTKKRSVQKYCR